MGGTLRVAGVLLFALLGYLLFWPVPIEPVAWQAPASAGYSGPHAVNERLSGVQVVSVAPEIGPEHIDIGPDGRLYTAVLSGAVLRMNPDGLGLETVVNTGGRPLGFDFTANWSSPMRSGACWPSGTTARSRCWPTRWAATRSATPTPW